MNNLSNVVATLHNLTSDELVRVNTHLDDEKAIREGFSHGLNPGEVKHLGSDVLVGFARDRDDRPVKFVLEYGQLAGDGKGTLYVHRPEYSFELNVDAGVDFAEPGTVFDTESCKMVLIRMFVRSTT